MPPSSFPRKPRSSGSSFNSSGSSSRSYAPRTASGVRAPIGAPRSGSFGRPSAPSRAGSYSSRSSSGGSSRYEGSRPMHSSGFGGGSSRYGARPSFGSRGGYSSGGSRFGGSRGGSRGGGKSERIDYARFVNKVTVTEEADVFTPEHKFADFKIVDALKHAILTKGYELPTPIQDRAIPHVLEGADIVGIANTGTGKTAAFLIPLINKVLLEREDYALNKHKPEYKNKMAEQIMIIVPTRELAIQIEDELKGFTKDMKIFGVCCVGGAPIGKQISQLKYDYNFIIGTPGRIKDLTDRKLIRLKEFNTIVLDEADRMLDMGFVNDMRAVMAAMPKERQTLFFSATLSSEIESLIGEFLRNPLRISVKTRDTSKNVEQDVIRVARGEDKMSKLHDLLNQKELTKVLIFGRTKHGVEKLSNTLIAKGFTAESIHGDKNHAQRQRALKQFKENKSQILVATDVAARGLDIADVSHVINYDLPATHDDYVHRIGRTGRGGKKGKALTFID